MDFYFYQVRSIGVGKSVLYIFLRLLRPLLLLKDKLFSIYREKAYWTYIYEYKNFNNIQDGDEKLDKRIDDYFEKYNLKINKYWHYCYINASGIVSEKYIPEYNFYEEIEPQFNRVEMAKGYDDKNIYDQLFPEIIRPSCFLRCINGTFYDQNYNRLEEAGDILKCLSKGEEYIIKPSLDGQGGKGVKKIKVEGSGFFLGENKIDVLSLPELYREDFVIQNIIKQHRNLDTIYPHSVNTIRVMTFRYNQQIHILSSIVRFGNHGSFVDNESSGGMSCGVNADGTLKNFAIAKKMDVYKKHPYTGEAFGGTVIPNYEEVKQITKALHKKLLYFDIVSWDIAINRDAKPVLIEMNLLEQGINFHQGTNGPLFGDWTDEVLEKVYIEN